MFYEQLLRTQIPKAENFTGNMTVIFALLGSAHVKAARRSLMKLTPDVNFINTLCAAFTHADPKSTKKTGNFLPFQDLKAVHRTLMKLAPGRRFLRVYYTKQDIA